MLFRNKAMVDVLRCHHRMQWNQPCEEPINTIILLRDFVYINSVGRCRKKYYFTVFFFNVCTLVNEHRNGVQAWLIYELFKTHPIQVRLNTGDNLCQRYINVCCASLGHAKRDSVSLSKSLACDVRWYTLIITSFIHTDHCIIYFTWK